MSQSCFDRSSLIINVGFFVCVCTALEVIVPVSAVTNASWLWLLHLMGKSTAAPPKPPPPPSAPRPPSLWPCFLSLWHFFSLSRCFDLSPRGLTVAFTHLYSDSHTHTHEVACLVSLQSGGDTVVGMCHSSIIDQIQLPSSTDHLEIRHCLCLIITHSHPSKLAVHSLACPFFLPQLSRGPFEIHNLVLL